jgi:hypothetical protein
MLRKYKWNLQDIWDTMKRPNLWITGVEEGEEIQTKVIDNLLNRITTENFPNLEKERVMQVQEAYRTSKHQNQKRNTPDTSQSKHTAHRTKIEFWNFKRDKTSYI